VDPDAAEVPAAYLPDDVLVYHATQRYRLPDVLGDEARRLFGGEKPGYRRVPGELRPRKRPAASRLRQQRPVDHRGCVRRLGVCRDFRPRRDQLLPGAFGPFRSVAISVAVAGRRAAPPAWASRRV